ncbi:KGK domain-containing protein [Nostoc sp. CCY 9925]|uniref:KGK domain-containing protein n=1 Tax=Nostoc sp. CCY 9925 TaxID=3103865 RepID=UPI0039C636F9
MHDAFTFNGGETLKVSQLHTAIKKHLGDPLCMWFHGTGIQCEVLREQGGGWQKGKIHFRLEFIPEKAKVSEQEVPIVTSELVSPLDDLRSNLEV